MALEEACREDIEFRQGLPLKFLSYMGVVHDPNSFQVNDGDTNKPKQTQAQKTKLEDQQKFEDKLKTLIGKLQNYVPAHGAADIFALDFVTNRLPPVENQKMDVEETAQETESGESQETAEADAMVFSPMLSKDCKVRLCNPEWLRLVVTDKFSDDEDEESDEDEDDDDEDDDDEDEDGEGEQEEVMKESKPNEGEKEEQEEKGTEKEKEEKEEKEKETEKEKEKEEEEEEEQEEEEIELLLYNSIHNSRSEHMSGVKAEPVCMKFPASFGVALKFLWNSYPNFVSVSSIPSLPLSAKLQLLLSLFSEGLLTIKGQEHLQPKMLE